MIIFLSGVTLLIIACVIYGVLLLLDEYVLKDKINGKITDPLYMVCIAMGICGALLIIAGCIKFIWWLGLGSVKLLGVM